MNELLTDILRKSVEYERRSKEVTSSDVLDVRNGTKDYLITRRRNKLQNMVDRTESAE